MSDKIDPQHNHIAVLQDQVIDVLTSGRENQNITVLDCTLGLGGHAKAILQKLGPQATYIGVDTDEQNVKYAKENLSQYASQCRFFHANFIQISEVLEIAELNGVDAILADLGFCSNQMDNPERGMSFMRPGPLDMRLDLSQDKTAADIVNRTAEKELADIIYQFGEERKSRRIAKAIVLQRKIKKFQTTAELAELIAKVAPSRPNRSGKKPIHPATKTFQALRIAVNDELGSLDKLLRDIPRFLNPDGIAAIISFHSLEDRRVKQAFAEISRTGYAKILTKKPMVATEDETNSNPRARSAKLRAIQRLSS